jgi:hypothetical protein
MNTEQKIQVITRCPFCEEKETIEVPADGYRAWQRGALVQDALPDLDAYKREQLITGTCPQCWIDVFESDEDFYA